MYNKNFKKRQQVITGLGVRTVFSNRYEAPFQPNKLTKYYGIIKVGEKSYISTYEAKLRLEAQSILAEEARVIQGELAYLGVFNK